MTPIIRPLSDLDIPAIVAIEQAAHDYPWSEAVFRDCLKANYHIWLLALAEPIGFLVVLDQVNECHLINIAVLPDYQRHGYGRQLLMHAIAYAQSQGFSRVSLEVRVSNQVAISLYRAVGFVDIGLRKKYYPKGSEREDALLMVLEINSA